MAVVTGGNGGIGRAITNRLLADGMRVVSLDRLFGEGCDERATRILTDLTDEAQVRSCFADIEQQLGPIEILVNNAGFYQVPRRPFWELDVDEWDLLLRSNIQPVFLCSRAVSSGMRERHHGGIVNIASGVVAIGMAGAMHYVAAKAAVVGMTRCMARELGPFDVTVNAIAPGLVPTPASQSSIPAEAFEYALGAQCIRRHVSTEQVADAVGYFCSSAAATITGQTLLIDGGAAFSGL